MTATVTSKKMGGRFSFKCILLVCFTLALVSTNAQLLKEVSASLKCFHSINYRFFDLKPLMKEG